MFQSVYDTDPITAGPATSDGYGDDVEMYGEDGTAAGNGTDPAGDGTRAAVFMVVGALALLWFMGAFVFKGSNQS